MAKIARDQLIGRTRFDNGIFAQSQTYLSLLFDRSINQWWAFHVLLIERQQLYDEIEELGVDGMVF